jgi:hypothetical protein
MNLCIEYLTWLCESGEMWCSVCDAVALAVDTLKAGGIISYHSMMLSDELGDTK